MPKTSAGILLYRRRGGRLEVLLVHPGGPLWARRDAGAWTIPKGLVEPGETPEAAAVRELREETGYAGSPPSHLGTVEPNPAILSNRCHTYVIRDCRPAGEQRLDPGEDIEVTTLPRSEVAAAVADGRIAHALVICAFWWLERAG
jgi:8-oxo-dGTP pyrophosphatase MutT (NUDIX family)